jgi:hypothetical protein
MSLPQYPGTWDNAQGKRQLTCLWLNAPSFWCGAKYRLPFLALTLAGRHHFQNGYLSTQDLCDNQAWDEEAANKARGREP